MAKAKQRYKASRKSVDAKHKPQGVETVLRAIGDISDEINRATADLDKLHDARNQMYLRGQEYGATVPQMAEAAGLAMQTVKYHLARLRHG